MRRNRECRRERVRELDRRHVLLVRVHRPYPVEKVELLIRTRARDLSPIHRHKLLLCRTTGGLLLFFRPLR